MNSCRGELRGVSKRWGEIVFVGVVDLNLTSFFLQVKQ